MSAPTIDEPTAAIIREAMIAVRAGRWRDARAIGERGLEAGNEAPALRAMLGAILVQMGEYRDALSNLEAAHRANPSDPIILRNLATSLVGLERFGEAADLLTDDVVGGDATLNLLRLRAYARHMGDDLAAGIADYRRYLEVHDRDWEMWNNLGNAYVTQGDFTSATEALTRAADINPGAAPTRLNLARSLRDLGELEKAEEELRAMAEDFPADPNPLLDLYHIVKARTRSDAAADEILESAARRDPDNLEVLIELGNRQFRAFDFARSEATFRRALAVDRASVPAFIGLVQLYEHNRPQELDALVGEAEAAALADEDRLNLIRAFAARRRNDFEAGLAALEDIPADVEPAMRWHLAGEMFNALGRHDEAFEAFSAMNLAQAQDESRPKELASEARSQLVSRLDRLTPSWRDSWRTEAVPASRPSPAFLVGFPRSGTTLLDTMLMGHPDAAVIEERPILSQLDLEFGGFEGLADLDEAAVRRAQDRYFELAGQEVDLSTAKLLVDKSPLYLHRVPQILRLFPDARFILALRHPADAVLSCFMANFHVTPSMANFLALDTAAEFYDLSFALWERSTELFTVNHHPVVYEKLIADPEGELRALAAFLDLSWDARMLDHQATARDRGVIATASYAQVTRPLYSTAVGRWNHYRNYLEPILPTLEPWARKFGYTI